MTTLLKPREVAAMLHISKPTLYAWIQRGDFPKGSVIGPRLRFWPREVVEEWVRQRTAGAAQVTKP